MSETFILLLIGIIGGQILAFLCIKSVLMNNQYKKLEESSKKLQLKINSARQMVEEFPDESSGAISNAIGEIGLEGIIKSLGLPSFIVPIAKGYIDNLLKDPNKIKSLAKSIGVQLPNEFKSEEGSFL